MKKPSYRSFRPSLEMLEVRDLPSVTVVNSSTVLVRGDNGGVRNDTYELSINPANGHFQVRQTLGGTAHGDVPASVTQIVIVGDGGRDTVQVKALPSNVTLTAKDIEVFSVGNSQSLANVLGKMVLTTSTHGPSTAVTINGSADATDHSITLTRDRLSGLTPQFTDFSGARLTSLIVTTGGGGDNFYVLSTKGPTTLSTGAGYDVIDVGESSSQELPRDLTRLTGKLTLNGGGADKLIVNDQNTLLTNVSDTVLAGNFTRSGMNGSTQSVATVDYHGFNDIWFYVGGASANVRIKSTAANAHTTLPSIPSANPVVVGNDVNCLDEIQGYLFVSSATGSRLTLADQGSTIGHRYSTLAYVLDGYSMISVARDIQFDSHGLPVSGIGIGAVGFAVTLTAGRGADTFSALDLDPSPTVTINGGDGDPDTLVAPGPTAFGDILPDAAPTTFIIDASDGGKVGTATFASIENLQGDVADDTFVFQTNAQGVAGRLTGQIDGGDGTNTLDFSALTAGVTVDLSAGTAVGAGTGVSFAAGIHKISNVTGSQGDDLIRGDNNPNELLGAGGNDILIGLDGADHLVASGTGRSLLIGGRGADVLEGGDGQDILIGGYFTNQLDDQNHDAVLGKFLDTWKGPGDYTTRGASLIQVGVAVDGVTYKLNNANIQNRDDAQDTLTGHGDLDWFWVRELDDQDVITDLASGEKKNDT